MSGFGVSCLRENKSNEQAMVLKMALEAYAMESGACLVRLKHHSLGNTFLAFCTEGLSPARCNVHSYTSVGELAQLKNGLTQIQDDNILCTVDTTNELNFLSSVQSPALPTLAKYGATRAAMTDDAIRFTSVPDCISTGLRSTPHTSNEFQSQLPVETATRYHTNATIYLHRYATQSACINSLALTASQIDITTNIKNGKNPDYILCSYGSSADPNYSICPAGVVSRFNDS